MVAGSGPIFLDQLACSESSESVLECNRFFAPTGLHGCDHSMDVSVRCTGKLHTQCSTHVDIVIQYVLAFYKMLHCTGQYIKCLGNYNSNLIVDGTVVYLNSVFFNVYRH